MTRLVRTLSVAVLLLGLGGVALPTLGWAQNGKLAGQVTDTDTGDPLPGATVFLEETGQGTAADEQGRYTVIGLTPGVYRVRFSFVGFAPKVFENIRVTSARTTTLNADLSSTAVAGGEVVVVAARPVVDPNQTTSRSLVTSEEISRLPVSNLDDVIARTSNAYEGFIRGSRRYETKTVIEGIDVSDAFYSLSQGQNYGGSVYRNANRAEETSPSILNLTPESVEEVAVYSGATEAQYTSGSGGVVAITLAEGRGPIRGSFSARVSPSVSRPGPDSLDFYLDGDVYMEEKTIVMANDPTKGALYTWTPDKYAAGDDQEYDIRFNLGGSLTDRWTFGASGQLFQTNGYLPNYFRKRINGQIKTSYDLSPKTKLTAVGIIEDRGLWGNWNNRDYMEFWRFYLEGVAQNDGGSYVGSFKLRQVLSQHSYLSVQLYRTYERTRYGYTDDDGDGFTGANDSGDFLDFTDPAVVERYIGITSLPNDDPRGRNEANNPKMFIDIVTDGFSEAGIFVPDGRRYKIGRPSVYSEDVTSATNAAKLDYVNQITYNHLLQAGVEFKARRFEFEEIDGLPGAGFILNDAEEPFILDLFERNPTELALYASDRIEYAGLIVNVGLRVEIINRDMEKITDYFYPFRRDTVDFRGKTVARNFFDRGESVPTDVFWNPRIGVSHPIGTRGAMYFSYARSQQLPPYNQLYQFYGGNHSTSRFFAYSDPEQDPITSNNFELGVQWEFAEGWGVDVNAYARSIDNYGSVNFTVFDRRPEGAPSTGLTRHVFATSFGYADARGIEVVLRRRPLEVASDVALGLTASYTFSSVEQSRLTGQNLTQFANRPVDDAGNAIVPADIPFENARDFQNFPQNVRGGSTITGGYDRTHRIVVRAVASLPRDFSFGLLATLESGFKYPRAIGADPRDRELLTGPTNHQIDIRVEKRFTFGGGFGVDFYLDMTNLLGRENIIAYEDYTASGPVIFQETGVPGSRLVRRDGAPLYGPARTIYFGSRLRF